MAQILKFSKASVPKPNMGLRGDFSPAVLEDLFPFKWVQCQTCGAYYCAREVYFITHQPPYKFRCECGPDGLYLRWLVEKSQSPVAEEQGIWQKFLNEAPYKFRQGQRFFHRLRQWLGF